MQFKLFLLLVVLTVLYSVQHVTASSSEALIECGRVHEIDNIANHSSASASYSNSQCMLVCVIGNVILPGDSIHEGHNCPEDTTGICRAGYCVGGQEDALRECGLKHHLDFHRIGNHKGTAFTNDQCLLKCVLGGDQLSAAHLHEGSPCPANPNGVCSSGTCVAQSTNQGSTVTPPQTTPIPPTTFTQPSIDSFSPSKMKLLNISLDSTDPPLKQDEVISLNFYKTAHSNYIHFSNIYGDSRKPNYFNFQTLNDIPGMLHKDSRLNIELRNPNSWLTDQHEDVYPVFAYFYQNHKLAFGEQENFVAKFPIYRRASLNDKVMDVSLQFTIVFSKD